MAKDAFTAAGFLEVDAGAAPVRKSPKAPAPAEAPALVSPIDYRRPGAQRASSQSPLLGDNAAAAGAIENAAAEPVDRDYDECQGGRCREE